MRLLIHHKLFLSFTALVAAVVVALTLGMEAVLRTPLIQQASDDLGRELSLALELYQASPETPPNDLANRMGVLTGHRVTIIDSNGTVVGESAIPADRLATLDNHAGRPEVVAAVRDGVGTSVRYSSSVDGDLIYSARIADDGRVLRFAMSTAEIDAAVSGVERQVLRVGWFALLGSALFALAFSSAVTRPLRRMRAVATAMSSGELSARVRMERKDELGDLATALDTLAAQLQKRLAQLEAEREETGALIDSMAEGIIALDSRGLVRRANPAAMAIFGLTQDPTDLPPEAVARRQDFLHLVDRVLNGEAVPPTELRYRDRFLVATAEPMPRGGAVLVFLDTTELRRLEGVRRDFVANASHELKTPLTVIRGLAETLRDDDLPPDLRRRFTQRLQSNAERLQAILEDLLDLSRIESGGWKVEPEPLELAQVARDVWSPFAEQARGKNVSFAIHTDAGAGRIEADRGALRQVFTNLFSNALRYTPPGGRIDVRINPASPPGSGATVVEVADTGVGISAKHLDRIFERFYRADPARSREEGGTGLGLAIVRHLIDRHGGTVGAESQLGVGTTIRFTLPLVPEGAEPIRSLDPGSRPVSRLTP